LFSFKVVTMHPRNRAFWPISLLLLSGCMSVWDSAGKPAPPLHGADSLGRPMDLNDCKGRVVLIDFWRTG
jgi:hypothetical protein